jgi:hypothetical protein
MHKAHLLKEPILWTYYFFSIALQLARMRTQLFILRGACDWCMDVHPTTPYNHGSSSSQSNASLAFHLLFYLGSLECYKILHHKNNMGE